ncbi:hypothetical protein CDQ84_05765 [Clostridium thermosuccinogenes]|uniref:Uncharacterized protein n=2 Tax=Clostridium thermosuccinogenes TaxID=84032 RepID=A0A2K2F1B8_9CLOT|nr:hypothetical protein CDO33_10160 [Pseudoclostridium thermosuccinogenes]PNT92566.1 hypothetical protein CDQ83_03100 [Pseudoclostridium thermosuccinogenes]PNT94666.1 hypothetical protein CDQ85_17460 [Pseudoclostridium thermosuccinogenes]PNU00589.1 hypothetical protein CDQ84_05765 [Pseudoclostridium thermosuccinogenes]
MLENNWDISSLAWQSREMRCIMLHYQKDAIEKVRKSEIMRQKYEIELNWIPERQLDIHCIGELFRGPKIPLLVQRIDSIFGNGQGVVNAFIGQASRDIGLYPEKWADLGSKEQLFQYIKQLWHTVAYFG